MLQVQIKNFEEEFLPNNQKLAHLENSRISLVKSFLHKKTNFNDLMANFLREIKINGIIPFAKYAKMHL